MTRWKAQIRLRMMLSHVTGAVAVVLLLELICAYVVLFVVRLSSQSVTISFMMGFLSVFLLLLLITLAVAMVVSLIVTRELINRMQRLIDATAQIATGHYEQRIQVANHRTIGMPELFEQHFNLIAEKLTVSIEQRRVLAEQNARLVERAHIFRDLHDGVKQQAFALTMQISTARALLITQPEVARSHIDNAETLAYGMQQELTSLIHSARPSSLSEKGLASVLQEYVTVWSRQQHIPVQQHIEVFAATPLLEETLLRITQEGLSNIARHSQATTVLFDISYSRREQSVKLVLQDNGCGFDATELMLESKGGIGLQSMRERIEALHGALCIESRTGVGTRIVASCPYQNNLSDEMRTSAAHLSDEEVV